MPKVTTTQQLEITSATQPRIPVGDSSGLESYWFAAGGSLLLFVATFAYFRRAKRAMVDELSSIHQEFTAHLEALESEIEAIALEVERIGEGRPFASRVTASEHENADSMKE